MMNQSLGMVVVAKTWTRRAWLPWLMVFHLGAQAGGAAPGQLPAPSKDDARAWLARLSKAATTTNFQGTMVFSAAGQVSTSRLTRYCVGPQQFEQSETLDGPSRLIFKHNHVVHTLWPSKRVAVVEQRETTTHFPSVPAGGLHALAGYDVRLEGVDRVAGHPAQTLFLAPKDGARFAQRLWADVDSGLMVRAEVLDPDGRVMESSAFSDLKVGVKPRPDQVTQAMHKLDGYRVIRTTLTRTKLEAEGWRLPVPVPGFQQVSCVSRPVDGGDAKPGAPTIVQSIFSDGLVHVSVFIEPYDAPRHKPMMSSWGATHALAQQRGDQWVTVMGDVPIETIKAFASALERLR